VLWMNLCAPKWRETHFIPKCIASSKKHFSSLISGVTRDQ
jgi:hypothetical protein